MTTDGQVLILYVLWKTVLSAKQCLLTKFWSSILSAGSIGSLTDSSKQWSLSFLWWHSIQVLLCCWFSRTRISAQFIIYFFFPLPAIFLYGKNVKPLALQMVSWSRDRRYLAAVTQRIWTRTRHMPYFPRLLLQPLWDYFIIPLWVELLRTHSCLLGELLKREQGLSYQWLLCSALTLAYAKVCRRAEKGQLQHTWKNRLRSNWGLE